MARHRSASRGESAGGVVVKAKTWKGKRGLEGSLRVSRADRARDVGRSFFFSVCVCRGKALVPVLTGWPSLFPATPEFLRRLSPRRSLEVREGV